MKAPPKFEEFFAKVKAAYKRTGLKPVAGVFFSDVKDKVVEACPLGAIFVDEQGERKALEALEDDIESSVVGRHVDQTYPEDWTEGLVAGFDGAMSYSKDRLYTAGYEAGQQIREKLLPKSKKSS